VGVGKREALRRETVEMGRLDFATRGIERLHVAVAEIVGEEVDDVGFRRRGGGRGERSRAEEEAEEREAELHGWRRARLA
jgi:hypothetical protein